MTPAMPILEMRGVPKSFPGPAGPVSVLRGVDLAVDEGDFVAVTGPSGAGKTTLLMLAGLLDRPTGGTILFDGADVSGRDENWLCHYRRRKVGVVFQRFSLLPQRTVLENVLFRFRYLEHDRKQAGRQAREALEVMGLADKAQRRARLLSSGEMQRVAIARAVAEPPRLLLADEPTGNLDRDATRVVMDCFRRLNASGLTIMMVTHNEDLLEYCTRHLVCRDGRAEEAALERLLA